MRTILTIIRKEFIQIFRNRLMLPFIFFVPIIQMVILIYAANLEMKEITFYVVDKDLSSTSRRITSHFLASSYFRYTGSGFDVESAEEMLARNKTDMVLHFHENFEQHLRKDSNASVQVIINAVNNTKASLINAYTSGIILNANSNIRLEWMGPMRSDFYKTVDISTTFWYNPDLDYKIYMLPGLLVILVTIIGMFLTALNLVREKEIGTTEQINVTPIRKHHFIIGKLFPFWVIALFELSVGLAVGGVFFNLPVMGSLLLLYGFASVYLFVVLGIGLFLSSISSNQQQVMFMTFFFMLTFILMSGIFTPVESMPDWAQQLNIFNPFAYFMRVIRMILLKGSGFGDIQSEFISMSIYAVIVLGLAIWQYHKVS